MDNFQEKLQTATFLLVGLLASATPDNRSNTALKFRRHPDIRQVPRKIPRIASDQQHRVNLVCCPDNGLEQPDAGSCRRDTARPRHCIVDGDNGKSGWRHA
ncbi:conserved hypothetical protein [Ricinus communis]|uniref:Uncharacterized protein n=1 Tax=Ricinus communis TaxID=3988 RepID=B9TEU9_RICCO|nr:conserved hypothetical protein [Ricinus communis]